MNKVIAITQRGTYTTTLQAADKILIADEPIALGGQDLGFSPYELLAASLASCTSITLTMYIKRKEWNVKKVNVEVWFERDVSLNTVVFQRNITVDGMVDKEQQDRLLSLANACPVHKTLTSSVDIQTKILL